MEKLKLILKKAIEMSASEVILEEEKEGEAKLVNGSKAKLSEFGKLEKKWLEELHLSFFAKNADALRKGEPQRGQLNIVKVGMIYLVAKSSSPKALTLFFPPTGEAHSQALLTRLNAAAHPAPKATSPGTKTESKPVQSSPSSAAHTQSVSNTQPVAGTNHETMFAEPPKTQAQAPTQAQKIAAASAASIVLDQAVLENASKLGLVVSTNPSVLSQAQTTFEELQLFTYKVNDEDVFDGINDRFVPQCIILDEEVPFFQKVLKRVYDMGIEKRLHTTVVMLSKVHRSDNMKLAFSFSVDLIVNIAELQNLSTLLAKSHSSRQYGVQTWLDLHANTLR